MSQAARRTGGYSHIRSLDECLWQIFRGTARCCRPILDLKLNEEEGAEAEAVGAVDPVDGAVDQADAVRQEKTIPPDDRSSFARVGESYGFV